MHVPWHAHIGVIEHFDRSPTQQHALPACARLLPNAVADVGLQSARHASHAPEANEKIATEHAAQVGKVSDACLRSCHAEHEL